MDINRIAEVLHRDGFHNDFISSMWDQFPIEEKKHFFRKLLTEFPELGEVRRCYLNPEGMDELVEAKFEDLPLSLWTHIRLGFDGQGFSCNTLRKKIDSMLR